MNKVLLSGAAGKDPISKTFQNGGKIVSFTFATTERWKDKDGNKKEATEWHNITADNKLADIIEKYVQKGSKLLIEGKIKTRSWGEGENKKYTTEIKAESVEFLSPKQDNGEPKLDTPNIDEVNEPDDLPF